MSHVLGESNTGSPEGTDFLSRTVGKYPIVTVQMGGKELQCLLDTGSMVTTITESYVGYIELDIDVLGVTLPKRGVLVLKDTVDTRKQSVDVRGLFGMNVINHTRLLLWNNFGSNYLNHVGAVSRQWAQTFKTSEKQNKANGESGVISFAKLGGGRRVKIPALSLQTVTATGLLTPHPYVALVERLSDGSEEPASQCVINTVLC